MPTRSPHIRRLLVIGLFLVIGLVIVGSQTIRLGRDVLWQLDQLSVTSTDNVQWNLVQSEVELMQLQIAVVSAQESRGSLTSLRRRFDVFYSRVHTFRESSSYAQLFQDAGSPDHIAEMVDFLDRWVGVIDGSDANLMASLEDFVSEIKALQPKVRSSSLVAVRVHASQSDARRDAIGQTLAAMVKTALGLAAILVAGVLLLIQMYQRLGRISKEREGVRARLEGMVSSSLDAILTINRSGEIRDFNAAAQELFGYSQAEMLGTPVTQLVQTPADGSDHPHDLVDVLLQAAHQSDIAQKRLALTGRRKSGEPFSAELSLSETYSESQEILVIFLRDISDRVRYENALRRARDEALAGEQAKSHLLTVMSHEMRTPLNGVLGALDLLEHQDLKPDQIRLVDAIRVSGDLLLHHVNDVLELSRLEAEETALNRARFDLERLAQALVDSQQAVARKGNNTLELRSNLNGRQIVFGDARLVQKAMLNLIGNALKFTRNGEVCIELDRLAGTAEVEIQIIDTGPGIADGDLDRIFDDFVTIDPSYSRMSEGTGLGLAIVKRMVEAMEGRIGVESVEGEGSLFWMRLPLPVVRSPETSPQGGVDSPMALQMDCARILVVEDNEINRMLLASMLRNQGHVVVEAEDGQTGIAAAQRQGFDLIFMDISMPGMDGIEAAHQIMRDGPNQTTPIVALTAHAGIEDQDRFMASGFVQVVTKPFTGEDLENAISRWTEYSMGSFLQGTGSNRNSVELLCQTVGDDHVARLLQDVKSDVDHLHDEIKQGMILSGQQKKQIHKLAGSIGVLGLQGSGFLVRLEMGDTEVSEQDLRALDLLRKEVHHLVLNTASRP
ncbi:response regulator [Rhodobacteraceae bacterium M382]|nr:response regulator [Rhodobacteraceae bacterium M382]